VVSPLSAVQPEYRIRLLYGNAHIRTRVRRGRLPQVLAVFRIRDDALASSAPVRTAQVLLAQPTGGAILSVSHMPALDMLHRSSHARRATISTARG